MQGKAYQSFRQIPCVSFLCWYAPVPVRGCSTATEHGEASAYRLGAFQPVRQRTDAFPLQFHNDFDSDWCLCIGRFSILPLLL